jgi:hypothetical protein
MNFRTRTPISDYYQHKEKLKKKEQSRVENTTFKTVSGNEQRPNRVQ